MFPTADDFARAIVAACRETGEDPVDVAKRSETFRARHYAFHALLQAFPSADRSRVADVLGCPGKPTYFHRSSLWWVLGQNPQRKPGARWWDAEALGRVCAVVGPPASPPRPVRPDPPARRPVPPPAPPAPPAPPVYNLNSKADLQRMLRDAVANTK